MFDEFSEWRQDAGRFLSIVFHGLPLFEEWFVHSLKVECHHAETGSLEGEIKVLIVFRCLRILLSNLLWSFFGIWRLLCCLFTFIFFKLTYLLRWFFNYFRSGFANTNLRPFSFGLSRHGTSFWCSFLLLELQFLHGRHFCSLLDQFVLISDRLLRWSSCNLLFCLSSLYFLLLNSTLIFAFLKLWCLGRWAELLLDWNFIICHNSLVVSLLNFLQWNKAEVIACRRIWSCLVSEYNLTIFAWRHKMLLLLLLCLLILSS